MDTAPQPQLRWTIEGFREGALATLPLMPGLCAFGLAFGTIAARKGLGLFDACIMSATVYAGVAQIIVVEFLAGAFDLCRRRGKRGRHRVDLLALHFDRRDDAALARWPAGCEESILCSIC